MSILSAKHSQCAIQTEGIKTEVILKKSHFTKNVALAATGDGGAIGVAGEDMILEVVGSSFLENSAMDIGGAISIMNATSVVLSSGTKFSKNVAHAGGAVYAQVCNKNISTESEYKSKRATHQVVHQLVSLKQKFTFVTF